MDSRRDFSTFSSLVLCSGSREKVLGSSASELARRLLRKLSPVFVVGAFVGGGLDAGGPPSFSLITTTKTQTSLA